MAADLFVAAGSGLALGLAFNPIASAVGVALAAGLATAGRMLAAVVVLAGAWLLGDGAYLLSSAADGLAGSGLVSGAESAQWVALGFWALAGIAIGYALPTWAGTFVGTRVTHGTGWLSAGVVAATASGALSMLSRGLGT